MIGIFDSGVGGLTVVRALRRLLPDAPLLYFGDTARTPYGNKGPETIQRFAVEDAQLLLDRGATVLVVACNTMSAVALEVLKKKFQKVSIFDVITPAVAAVVQRAPDRVGVIGTRATIGSGVYERRIKEQRPKTNVVSQACPMLVPFIEEGLAESSDTTRFVRRYLIPLLQHQVQALVLGCTHYPFVKKAIAYKMGKRTTIIDSAEVTATAVAEYARKHPEVVQGGTGLSASRQGVTLLFSDLAAHTEELARAWAGPGVKIEPVSIQDLEEKH